MFYIGVGRIAQEQELDDGDEEHDGQGARIADDVQELFAHDG
jgi:hypothetical protein